MGKFIKGDIVVVPFPFSDLSSSKLLSMSYVRPTRIFTADKNIIVRKVGNLKQEYFDSVIDRLFEVLKN